jgi:hypothetical protein
MNLASGGPALAQAGPNGGNLANFRLNQSGLPVEELGRNKFYTSAASEALSLGIRSLCMVKLFQVVTPMPSIMISASRCPKAHYGTLGHSDQALREFDSDGLQIFEDFQIFSEAALGKLVLRGMTSLGSFRRKA